MKKEVNILLNHDPMTQQSTHHRNKIISKAIEKKKLNLCFDAHNGLKSLCSRAPAVVLSRPKPWENIAKIQ